jgi:hypothetical protein
VLAVGGVDQLDPDRHRDVAALHRSARPAAAERALEARTEEGREEVGDRPEVAEVRLVAAGAQALVTVRVVLAALLGIGQHLVGLGGLLELGLGIRVVGVDVRVQLPRQAPEGLLDRRLVGIPGHAQDLVVVAGHAQLAS